MRARFSIKTTLGTDDMHGVFEELHWIPNFKGDNSIEAKLKESFISSLPMSDDTQSLVRETFCFLIYDYSSSVWRVVNEPAKNIFTVRIGHEDIETLRIAAHHQLEKLLQVRGLKIKLADDGDIKFFERDGSRATISAQFKGSQDVLSLLKAKKQAAWSAIITATLGAVTTAFSHPELLASLKETIFSGDVDEISFWEQFAGRVATALFVGFILAVYDVVFYVRTQRNSPSITLRSQR